MDNQETFLCMIIDPAHHYRKGYILKDKEPKRNILVKISFNEKSGKCQNPQTTPIIRLVRNGPIFSCNFGRVKPRHPISSSRTLNIRTNRNRGTIRYILLKSLNTSWFLFNNRYIQIASIVITAFEKTLKRYQNIPTFHLRNDSNNVTTPFSFL